MPTLPTSDGDLFYTWRDGHKPPLLLLHGAASSHLAWPAQLRSLPRRAILAPDLSGHGRSGGVGHQTIHAYARSVLAFLDALNLPSVVPVGHSMGGAIAQALALLAPQRCAGLILIATAARFQVNQRLLELAQTDLTQTAALLNQWSWSKNAPADLKAADLAALQASNATVLYGDYLACHTFDSSEQLAQITAPCLVLYGQADKMITPALSLALSAALPQAQAVEIPTAGHWVTLEQPQAVTDAIQAWLEATAL
jgi:pimeloyl-ACP methyl ester carboxylesterase